MSGPVSGVTPRLLEWARNRTGLSVEEVAARLNKAPDDVRAWESGKAAPTYVQLETLAYKIYKRPLALFFFPEPPDEPDVHQSFRTLPDTEIADLDADTIYKLRQGQALQLSLRELFDGENPADRKVFRDVVLAYREPANDDAERVRDFLGISIETQKAWKNSDGALKAWRVALENAGIFVFKNTFKQKDFWGFCLDDPEFPIIYLNNSAGKNRQIFTLLHELAHVLVHSSGVTLADDSHLKSLKGESKAIEVYCNRFTGLFLVPASDLRSSARGTTDAEVARLAHLYKVSREMVLRRLLDLRLVGQDRFREATKRLHDEYARREVAEAKGGGGDYYATQYSYLGSRFLEAAFRRFYEGRISEAQLADHLGVKVRSLPEFEHHFSELAVTK